MAGQILGAFSRKFASRPVVTPYLPTSVCFPMIFSPSCMQHCRGCGGALDGMTAQRQYLPTYLYLYLYLSCPAYSSRCGRQVCGPGSGLNEP